MVSVFPFEGFSSKFASTHILYKGFKLGFVWSIFKGTLLENFFLLGSISASIRGIFLKIHVCHSTHKLGCDQSTVEGALLGNQWNFSAMSRFPLKGCSYYSTYIRDNRRKISWDRPKIKGTLQDEERTLSAVVRFPLEGFSWIRTSRTPRFLSTKDESFFAIMQ